MKPLVQHLAGAPDQGRGHRAQARGVDTRGGQVEAGSGEHAGQSREGREVELAASIPLLTARRKLEEEHRGGGEVKDALLVHEEGVRESQWGQEEQEVREFKGETFEKIADVLTDVNQVERKGADQEGDVKIKVKDKTMESTVKESKVENKVEESKVTAKTGIDKDELNSGESEVGTRMKASPEQEVESYLEGNYLDDKDDVVEVENKVEVSDSENNLKANNLEDNLKFF